MVKCHMKNSCAYIISSIKIIFQGMKFHKFITVFMLFAEVDGENIMSSEKCSALLV